MNEREDIINVFGWCYKAVYWRFIPGNDDIINLYSDESAVREMCWKYLDPNKVIIDVGAGFGLYTLPALMHKCIVHAIEPNKRLFDILIESVNMNEGFADRFFGYNIGLWNNTEYPKDLINNCKILDTLDNILKNLKRIDIIKIDADGAELGILEGSKEIIKKYRPEFLIEDYFGRYCYNTINNTGQNIINLLNSLDYSVSVGTYIAPPPVGKYFFIAKPK